MIFADPILSPLDLSKCSLVSRQFLVDVQRTLYRKVTITCVGRPPRDYVTLTWEYTAATYRLFRTLSEDADLGAMVQSATFTCFEEGYGNHERKQEEASKQKGNPRFHHRVELADVVWNVFQLSPSISSVTLNISPRWMYSSCRMVLICGKSTVSVLNLSHMSRDVSSLFRHSTYLRTLRVNNVKAWPLSEITCPLVPTLTSLSLHAAPLFLEPLFHRSSATLEHIALPLAALPRILRLGYPQLRSLDVSTTNYLIDENDFLPSAPLWTQYHGLDNLSTLSIDSSYLGPAQREMLFGLRSGFLLHRPASLRRVNFLRLVPFKRLMQYISHSPLTNLRALGINNPTTPLRKRHYASLESTCLRFGILLIRLSDVSHFPTPRRLAHLFKRLSLIDRTEFEFRVKQAEESKERQEIADVKLLDTREKGCEREL